MSEKTYFKNLREYREYKRADKNKLEITKFITIEAMRDNVKDSLVFILSNNTAYFFSEYEVLEDGHTLPKDRYVFQKLAYNGLKQYNNPSNIELVSTNYTDSFSFNRNNYMELVIKGYNKNRKYQLKIKVLDYVEKKPKETINLNFEIPQGYYRQEQLNNYIKNSISNLLNNSSVDAYSSTEGNITMPLNKIISHIDIEDID